MNLVVLLALPAALAAEPAVGLDPATQTVREHRDEIDACYERRLAARPGIHGKISLGLHVRGGEVRDVTVFENQTGDRGFARCVSRRVLRWRFDGSVEGVVYPTFVMYLPGS